MENKILKHIDTLYLYYKCDYEEYIKSLEVFADNNKFSSSNGYDWYYFGDYARVGVQDFYQSEKSSTYPIIIQYNATYLLTIDVSKELELFFTEDRSKFLVKRIDFSQTIKTDFLEYDFLNMHCVSKYFRKGNNHWSGARKTDTMYLGQRKTGKVFRLYNKTKELADTKNHIKAQILNSHFGSVENLVVFELELHRKYLRDRCNINTLAELEKIREVSNHLLSTLQFCNITDKNMKNITDKNYERIEFFTPFNDSLQFDYLPVKRYKKSKSFLLDNISDIIKQYNSKDGDNIDILSLVTELASRDNEDDIITIEFDKYMKEDNE